ncbi:unnamed protein product [Colias eurytheme]|nr:unnamed protein product [Colias eurytheme]
MEEGYYTQRRSYHDVRTYNNQTAALLQNVFVAPLPYVGSTLSGLNELPRANDKVASLDTQFEHNYNSWNIHNRGVLTSFYTKEKTADVQRQRPRKDTVTILCDGALEQVLRCDPCISTMEKARLQNGTLFLSSAGDLLDSVPRGASYRSSVYNGDGASNIAALVNVPRIRNASPDRDDVSDSTSVSTDSPTEPAERSKVKYVPARSVGVSFVSFQAEGPTEPPYSNIANQMAALTSTPEKQATQPLLATARSPLARDLPSMQFLKRYVMGRNASYIDTAPALRGLLYAFPQCQDAFDFDRTTNHFLRREKLNHQPDRESHVHQWPQDQRWVATVIAVTLPAFTNHLEHGDTNLFDLWPASQVDQEWVAVPVPSGLTDIPWFKEYLLCFLDTQVWAGRLSYRTSTVHTTAGDGEHETHFTQIPHAHNVSIPGPHGLMLVFLDEYN